MAEFEFLSPTEAWDMMQAYYDKYYRANIAAYSGDRTELSATSDNGMFWAREGKCKVHVPIAADIAAVSANLLFAGATVAGVHLYEMHGPMLAYALENLVTFIALAMSVGRLKWNTP